MIRLSATVPLQYDTVFSPFAANEFADGLAWLKQNKFDGIEICIAQPGKVDGKRLQEQVREYGLAIATISTGQALGLEGISLTSLNPDIRAKAIIRIKEHIELATQLGSPLVTIGLIRGIGSLESRQQQLELFLESLSACAAYAQEHGVRLMVEPINRSETFLLNSTAETLEFLAKLPNGNVGVLLDTFHSNLEDVSIVDAIDMLGAKLFHIHFADSNRGLPGMGTIDFSAVVKALAGQSFNGFISLEALTLPDKETVRKESYSRLTQYFVY